MRISDWSSDVCSSDLGVHRSPGGVRFPLDQRGVVVHDGVMHTDREACYQAVKSKDRRFDGIFYTAVRTTGIYCRPSCPARTPALKNSTFHPTAAPAPSPDFRAYQRCLPAPPPATPPGA